MIANFSNKIEYNDMIKPLLTTTDVLKVRCEYNCYCYPIPLSNDIFYCQKIGNLTREDIYNTLIENGYSTKCNHNFLEDVFVVSNNIVIPIFGK
jgi:hypothetical protein